MVGAKSLDISATLRPRGLSLLTSLDVCKGYCGRLECQAEGRSENERIAPDFTRLNRKAPNRFCPRSYSSRPRSNEPFTPAQCQIICRCSSLHNAFQLEEFQFCCNFGRRPLDSKQCSLNAQIWFPSQALCQQTLDDWTAKFSPLGTRLAELTSDSTSGPSKGSVSLRDLASADIILTTPEKWDSITRRWKEHAFLVSTILRDVEKEIE